MFSILTRDAAESIKSIHARMPVILMADQVDDCLSPEKLYSDMLPKAVEDLEVRTA